MKRLLLLVGLLALLLHLMLACGYIPVEIPDSVRIVQNMFPSS